MNTKHFKNKKILITGADGFIGSHLVESLVKKGFNVKAFVFYNSFNSLGWIDTLPIQVKNELEIISGDIRNTDIVRKSISDCNTVIHLAALIAIPFSYHSPEAYVNTNIMGTLNVLQSAKDYELEKIIITSTSEVYGTAKYTPIDENHPKQGQSPYSATKISADQLALTLGQPLAFVVPHLDRHAEALALQFATPDRRGRVAEGETGDNIGSTGDRRQAQVRFEAAVDVIKALVRQRRTGRQHRLQAAQLVAAMRLDAGLFQRGQVLGAGAEHADVFFIDQVDQPLGRGLER